jgi:hypothetical protein
MSKTKLGKLPPRYSFMLNPYKDIRVSKCPRCRKLTHMRKFVLLVHVEGWGLFAQGKTCRYCTPCELIIAHKDELEGELVRFFERHSPEMIGNPYLALGTVVKEHWKQWLGGEGEPLLEALEHVADIKKVLELRMTGGWQPMSKSRPAKKS